MTRFDKLALLKDVTLALEEQKQLLVQAAQEARDYSTNEESKAENKYDTRGLEASYLASGQSKRAQEIQEKLFQLEKVQIKDFAVTDPVGMGSLVEVLVDEKTTRWLFLLPVGGIGLAQNKQKVQTITVESPIGSQILGQVAGFEFEINNRVFELVSVQ